MIELNRTSDILKLCRKTLYKHGKTVQRITENGERLYFVTEIGLPAPPTALGVVLYTLEGLNDFCMNLQREDKRK